MPFCVSKTMVEAPYYDRGNGVRIVPDFLWSERRTQSLKPFGPFGSRLPDLICGDIQNPDSFTRITWKQDLSPFMQAAPCQLSQTSDWNVK